MIRRRWPSTTFFVAMTAPSGAYPLERPLAAIRMSGAMSQCSMAKFLPVRPMPVMTSSAISRTPWRRQTSATFCRYPGGGTTAPSVAPLTGSKMNAAASPLADFNGSLQLGRVLLTAVAAAVRAVVVAAIAIWNSYVRELAHHGQIDFAAPLVAGDRERAQSRAVIALTSAEDLVAFGLSDLHLILPRQLQGGLDRLRTAAGEVHGAAAEILAGKVEQFARVVFRDRRGELAGVDELQLRACSVIAAVISGTPCPMRFTAAEPEKSR